MIFVYVTVKSVEEAKNISKCLLQKKLIACANFFPITSMYRWSGKIVDDSEVVLLLKTVEEKYSKIVSIVEKIHSYDTPCVIKIPVSSNANYLEWIHAQM